MWNGNWQHLDCAKDTHTRTHSVNLLAMCCSAKVALESVKINCERAGAANWFACCASIPNPCCKQSSTKRGQIKRVTSNGHTRLKYVCDFECSIDLSGKRLTWQHCSKFICVDQAPKTSVAFFSIATIYMQQQLRIYLIANFQVTAARQMTIYRGLPRSFHFPFLLP